MKRQPSEWEKIIASKATDKGLISKINKQLIQLNTGKTDNPIKEWEKDLNRHFFKEDIQRRLTNTRKMLNIVHCWRNANQNYNEMSPHTGQNGHHQKMYKQTKKSTNKISTKCWKECGEKRTLLHC